MVYRIASFPITLSDIQGHTPIAGLLKYDFGATVCRTVRPMLSDRCPVCLSVLSVCNVGVLWPNGWTDQDETWRAGRPRPWPHCVRWELSSPSPKGHSPSQFLPHICCGQMALWIKMLLGREVGLDPSDIVLDGEPAPLSPRRGLSVCLSVCLSFCLSVLGAVV